MGSAEFDDRSHGIGPEDVDRDESIAHDNDGDWFDEDFDSKTVKIALGGIAAGGLLTGIYVIAHRRLNRRREE